MQLKNEDAIQSNFYVSYKGGRRAVAIENDSVGRPRWS